MNRKIFVLDTSVLLYDSQSIHTFSGNNVVLPMVVLEELDKFKERSGLIGENARYVNRFLDKLRSIDVDKDGWKYLEKYDINYKFALFDLDTSALPQGMDKKSADNLIISCALHCKKHFNDSAVKVITKDINLRVKCDALSVYAEDYFKDHIDDDVSAASGWSELYLESAEIDSFYDNGKIMVPNEETLFPNQFIIGKSESKSFLGIHKSNSIKPLVQKMNSLVAVEPRNSEQSFAIEALMDPNIPLVTLTGLAGSGKTFLALMAGLSGISPNIPTQMSKMLEIREKSGYERLIITRTLQPVGRDLGYLPGSMEDKMAPWLMPIMDNVRHAFKDVSYFKMMIDQGDVEIAPIPYIRGRTFNNSFVIVDEAQNATIHELKTIITRIGQGSKIILLGDVDQIDTPYIDKRSNGLSIVIDKFKSSPLAAHINLSKGQRSDLASSASNIL
jgi:PhoH-like ATPase